MPGGGFGRASALSVQLKIGAIRRQHDTRGFHIVCTADGTDSGGVSLHLRGHLTYLLPAVQGLQAVRLAPCVIRYVSDIVGLTSSFVRCLCSHVSVHVRLFRSPRCPA